MSIDQVEARMQRGVEEAREERGEGALPVSDKQLEVERGRTRR
jgi:hypothetical protein